MPARSTSATEAAAQRLAGVDDVVVADHHALRRAGGARRVDDRGERLRGDRLGGSFKSTVPCPSNSSGAARRQVDDLAQGRQVLADLKEPLEEAVVADHGDLRLAVADEVGDLVGRRRVVDRDGCGAAEHAWPCRRRESRTRCASSGRRGRRARRPRHASSRTRGRSRRRTRRRCARPTRRRDRARATPTGYHPPRRCAGTLSPASAPALLRSPRRSSSPCRTESHAVVISRSIPAELMSEFRCRPYAALSSSSMMAPRNCGAYTCSVIRPA